MSVLSNVLEKMQATPTFRPMTADTFGDWSIEAGDIVSVDIDGKSETLPVFSSSMEWNGAARTTLSCSGNEERQILTKQERQSYSSIGGAYQAVEKLSKRTDFTNAVVFRDDATFYDQALFRSYAKIDTGGSLVILGNLVYKAQIFGKHKITSTTGSVTVLALGADE